MKKIDSILCLIERWNQSTHSCDSVSHIITQNTLSDSSLLSLKFLKYFQLRLTRSFISAPRKVHRPDLFFCIKFVISFQLTSIIHLRINELYLFGRHQISRDLIVLFHLTLNPGNTPEWNGMECELLRWNQHFIFFIQKFFDLLMCYD